MASPIVSLAELITFYVDKIDRSCVAHNVQMPSLDSPITPESEQPWTHPDILEAAEYVVAAAAQLIAIVRPSSATLLTTAAQVGFARSWGVFS